MASYECKYFITYRDDSTAAKFVRIQVSNTPRHPLTSFFSLKFIKDLLT